MFCYISILTLFALSSKELPLALQIIDDTPLPLPLDDSIHNYDHCHNYQLLIQMQQAVVGSAPTALKTSLL